VGIDTLTYAGGTEVVIEVVQGERTINGDVMITGEFSMSEPELLRRLDLEKGSPFLPGRIGDSARRLVRYMGDSGRPFAQVWITGMSYDPGTNSMDITVSIYEGDRAVVSQVVFEGISKTDSTIAGRIARLERGSAFSERRMEKGVRYLTGSRIFESVGQPRVARRDASRVDLFIPVTEKKHANSFSGVFGFSKKDNGKYQANGSIEMVLTNIGGKGRDVRFDWLNDGRKYSRTRLEAGEPFLFSSPLRLDMEVGQAVNDTIYDMISGGMVLRFPLGPAWSIGGGMAGDRTVFGDDSGLDRSSRQRYRLDLRRDAGTDWTLDIRLEGARKNKVMTGGEREKENQLIYDATLEWAAAITGSQVVAARLVSQGVLARGDISLSEMFPLGGAKHLRGYRENQFRGEKVEYLSLEYRFGGENRIFLFDDLGGFYRKDEGWTVKNGFGFGLRSSSRAGTIELSFAVGDKFSLGETKIHISLIEVF
ncbi:MAG TPA: POTRA domain-containing protein, partial [Candidatus Krumholzibacterium sp.]|nr:POTRA domain-containing protein [Candidatus Krumholzibacterium sp.]